MAAAGPWPTLTPGFLLQLLSHTFIHRLAAGWEFVLVGFASILVLRHLPVGDRLSSQRESTSSSGEHCLPQQASRSNRVGCSDDRNTVAGRQRVDSPIHRKVGLYSACQTTRAYPTWTMKWSCQSSNLHASVSSKTPAPRRSRSEYATNFPRMQGSRGGFPHAAGAYVELSTAGY